MAKRKISKKIRPIKRSLLQNPLIDLEKRITKSYKKLSSHILKNAPYKTLQKESAELMILLGEANYLAKECKRIKKIAK